MPLPGGPADKAGNRYENWWTLLQVVRMLHGTFDSIRLEPPGVDKAEFLVTAGSVREWHQVKRSHPTGKWTMAALSAPDMKLLQAMGEFLSDSQSRFVFASSSDARELAELSERAKGAGDAKEFESTFLATREHFDRFVRLCDAWMGCDLETAYDRLKRIEVRAIDEAGIEQQVRWGIAVRFLGDATNVVDELRTILEDSVHRTITRDGLIDRLAAGGLITRRVVTPDSARAVVNDATRHYLDDVRRKLIRQTLVPRGETQSLRNTRF